MRFPFTRLSVVVCLLVGCVSIFGATYVVPNDHDLVAATDAIVVASATYSFTQPTAAGGIETVTRFRVEEVIKGSAAVDSIDVHEPGGAYGNRIMSIPGVPRFESNERVILLLRTTPQRTLAVTDLALGKFNLVTDAGGRKLALRSRGDIVGWNPDGTEHVEQARDAAGFLAFLRAEAHGKRGQQNYFVDEPALRAVPNGFHAEPNAVSASSYMSICSGSTACRWDSFPSAVNWYIENTEPGASGTPPGNSAANTAIGRWVNDSGSLVTYSYQGSESGHTGGLNTPDNRNTIQFERDLSSFGVGAYSCSGGVLGIGGITNASGSTYQANGETFFPTTEGDVEMNQGIQNCPSLFSSGDFTTAVTHEVGHTLGFRHSDQTRADNPSIACSTDASLDCSSSAVMKASILHNINGQLQTWDQSAVRTVYPDPNAPGCTAASITSNPQGATIASGNSTTLSVSASGTAPIAYQWYVGNPPSTASPVAGGTTASIQVSPTTTTTYWAQVSNSCGTANSTAATVTVQQSCPTVVVGNPTGVDLGGNSFQLSVSASGGTGLTYEWFQGSSVGSGSSIGFGNPINVSNVTSPTSFWVRVTNSCNNSNNSPRVVTVGGAAQCNAINILQQPQDQSVLVGGTVQLTVGFIGTAPVAVNWFKGAPPDTSQPVGSGQTVTSPAINATSTFYARLSNCAGVVTSNVVTVTATQTCTAPAIVGINATPMTASPGTPIALTVNATGSSLTYQWYRGASGDTSNPIDGATTSSITDTPAATTSYWVRVSSGCGANAADSQAVTVTISSACVAPLITQPPDQTITYGEKATLTVTTTAGSEPLHYSWFQGGKFDTSHPLSGDSPAITTPSALTQDTQFFVNVSNSCGNVNSETITVKVELPRRRPTRH